MHSLNQEVYDSGLVDKDKLCVPHHLNRYGATTMWGWGRSGCGVCRMLWKWRRIWDPSRRGRAENGGQTRQWGVCRRPLWRTTVSSSHIYVQQSPAVAPAQIIFSQEVVYMILFSKYVLIPLFFFFKHFVKLRPSAKEKKNHIFPLQSRLKTSECESEPIICSVLISSSSQPLVFFTLMSQSLHAWIWGCCENPPCRSSQTLSGRSGDLWLGSSQCSG